MSNLQLLPQFDGNNTSFSISTNSDWIDIIYFTQPGFGSPIQVFGCSITSGSNTINVTTSSGLYPGMTISSLAQGIPVGSFIGVVSETSLTMVALNGNPLNATATNIDMTLNFNPPPLDLTGINFLCNLRRQPGGMQVFLTAQTPDGSMVAGGQLGTLQFAVPYTSLQAIPAGTYYLDMIAADGTNTLNLFQNAPATVTLTAGISDPSLFT